MRHAAALILPCVLIAVPVAQAQPLRVTVVPGDAAVVIPARGQPLPMAAAPRPTQLPSFPVIIQPAAPTAVTTGGAMGLAAVPGLLLPFAAAALIGGGLPGSGGGGGSAPASTR